MAEQTMDKKSFVQGLIAGMVIVIILGGVYVAGQNASGTGGSLAKAPTVAAPTAPTTNPTQPSIGKVKAADASDHIIGAKKPAITLIEYSDLECPFCKRFHPTMQQVMKDYAGKVAWVYRHYPLSFHANAQKEAEAAECANKLGGNDAFWKYIDAIYERTTSNGTGFALTSLVPLAKEIGLDETKFKTCLDSGEMQTVVAADLNEGQQEGVTGTPGTFVVNAKGDQQYLPGALDLSQVKQVIDSLL